MPELPAASVDLIYIDPPFNTGRIQERLHLRTKRDPDGDRVGFQGARYRTERVASEAYEDRFDDYLAFLEPSVREAHRLLKPTGSFYFHIDYREVHYCKVFNGNVFIS